MLWASCGSKSLNCVTNRAQILTRWETGTITAIGHRRQDLGVKALEAVKVSASLLPGTGRFYWKNLHLKQIFLWTCLIQIEAEELQGKTFLLGAFGGCWNGLYGLNESLCRKKQKDLTSGKISHLKVEGRGDLQSICPDHYALSFFKCPAVERWRTHPSK